MKIKLIEPINNSDGNFIGYTVECPGCEMIHLIYTVKEGNRPCWRFNNDFEKPTFSPSLLVKYNYGEQYEKRVCHSFIENGKWRFLGDCTHKLAGQIVDMIPMED